MELGDTVGKLRDMITERRDGIQKVMGGDPVFLIFCGQIDILLLMASHPEIAGEVASLVMAEFRESSPPVKYKNVMDEINDRAGQWTRYLQKERKSERRKAAWPWPWPWPWPWRRNHI